MNAIATFVTEYVLQVIQKNGNLKSLLESYPWQLQIIQLLHLQLK